MASSLASACEPEPTPEPEPKSKLCSNPDLNRDGTVDLLDLAIFSREWLRVDSQKVSDLMHNAVFTRGSIAFLDGKEYVADAPRRKLVAVSGLSDVWIHGVENVDGGDNVILSPKGIAGNYIYATNIDKDNIYRSLDGTNWEQITDGLTDIHMIYGTQTGAILIAKAVCGQMNIFRSTVGGGDLTDSTLPAPSIILPKSADGLHLVSVALWSFHQGQNGTICLNEYGNSGWPGPEFERDRIYRSTDDGITFVQVYEEPDVVRHSHIIMKHEATGRWVNVFGDGSWVNKVVKSDDDGVNWSTLDPQLDSHFQPVDFYDYGHPTKLLYGSDGVAFIGTFDVMTAEVTPLYADGDRVVWPYVFSIFYHEGVFYAGTYSEHSESEDRRMAILVSSDLNHWAVYHQFRNGEKTVNRFLGVYGNKIHGIVTMEDGATWRHFSFTPTTVEVVNGLCLDPATTNLLDTAQYSSVETDTSFWSCGTATGTRMTTDSLHGSACFCVTGDCPTVTVYPRCRPVVPGKTYSGRIWLKGNAHNQMGRLNWFIYGSSRRGSDHYYHLSQEEWTEIVLEPVTIDSNETHMVIHVRPRSGNPEFLGPYSFMVDAAQYEESPPSRWQVGGIPRADETLSKTTETPEEWTEEILWAPECRSEWYANSGNQYIKSWCKDPNNYMELYYDPCGSTFVLQTIVEGHSQTAIISSSYSFYRNSVIRFIIKCNEELLQLSVAVAGPFEHISGPPVDFLRSATLTSKTGNRDGVGVMSCTILTDKLYDGAVYIIE